MLTLSPFRSWSIRWRLTAWYALSSLLILIVAGAIAYYAFRTTFIQDTDHSLTIKGMEVIYSAAGSELLHRGGRFVVAPLETSLLVQKFQQQFGSDAFDPLGDPIYMRLFSTNPKRVILISHNVKEHDLVQRTLKNDLELAASQTVNGCFDGFSQANELRVMNIRVPRQPLVLQLATPWTRYESTLDSTINIIAGVIAFGFALSALGGWLLVSRTLQPITEIVTEASKMSGNRLEPAFVAARTMADDEIGHLVAALNEMMGRVHRAIESQRQFTADASHDLKTPLAILRGEMELALARERSSDEYRGVLVSGLEETERLIRIVNDLRELATADLDSQRRFNRRPIDLRELAASVMLSRSRQAVMCNIDLRMKHSVHQNPAFVFADSLAIERAIGNLLDNAINYNSCPGKITLNVTVKGNNACVEVSDTGQGIGPSDQAFIFDRFYRGDKSRSTNRDNDAGHSGLGLAIVKSVVAAHGGTVEVQSTVGSGSVFTIYLPVHLPDESVLHGTDHRDPYR